MKLTHTQREGEREVSNLPRLIAWELIALSRRGLDPIQLTYGLVSAQLTVSAFNRTDQYASNPAVYCYAELAVSSPAVVATIASTHCAYPRRDGQAELA